VIGLWQRAILARRSGALLRTAVGTALTVGLLGSLGAFLVSSSASMTLRAIAGVPVDWQIELLPGADPQVIAKAAGETVGYSRLQQVGYADAAGFSARTGGTVQATGPGKVVGLDPSYRRDFPAQLRLLIGSLDGVLVAQQTAANLHVGIGDKVTIERVGVGPAEVTVDGVVDLPNADLMFQAVGMPPGAAPQAPPDNVLLLPGERWHALFDPQAAARPDTVRAQLHLGLLRHRLRSAPDAAYAQVLGAARKLEARIAGSGIVADNLAARLDAIRGDALYARVLFLFLGTPGALLAILLTVSIAASGSSRRRREQALLRARGASVTQILLLSGVEAVAVAVLGILGGLLLVVLTSRLLLGADVLQWSSLAWVAGAAAIGLLATVAAALVPAWLDARDLTVARARTPMGARGPALWQRLHLDLLLLFLAALLFWQTASTGYQVVLAPEGVPATAVDYYAFISPALLWMGVAFLAVRLLRIGFGPGRDSLGRILRPVAGNLSRIVAASLGRQHGRAIRGVVLVAASVSFAASTAVFDTTYNAQSLVDAQLTNGADVTVTGTAAAPAGSLLPAFAAIPGVVAAEALQHRFAYVGTDLQDLYGIDAARIGAATSMSDAYFQGGNAKAMLERLAGTLDGLLVSEETVNDFQLQPGDRINLRLLNLADHQYHAVSFRFVGVVREFPSAPRDSFLVANASYIGSRTGSAAGEIVLLRTAGDPKAVADAARRVAEPLPGARVTDIHSTLSLIASSLTAVDLAGLTRLELGYAVLMVIGAAGVAFALDLADRRRSFAILAALGAKPRQLGAFLWAEGLLILLAGTVIGLLTGFLVADMLVKLLTGVFDPPPESLSVPWPYLAATLLAMLASVVAALLATQAVARRQVSERLRGI
jgi:putative ABC transport system permease protein